MGKRKGNITGLARFVFEVTNGSPQPNEVPSTSETHSGPANDVLDTQRDLDEPDPRPTKKARLLKAGLLGPGLEKYDATGLVPCYTDASQVPDHLQKCE